MSQTSLSVWFVCRLCRGSFGQVDAFIEHKKQKHFTQFQNTTSIVFEERDEGLLYPLVTNGDHQLGDESNEPAIKIEVKDEEPIIPFSSEIIDEQNLCVFELKSEPVTYKSEIIPDTENSFFGWKQPEKNPYVLLKRLTSQEIQSACVPQHHTTLLKCEQIKLKNSPEPHYSLDLEADSIIVDHNEDAKLSDNQPSATVTKIPTEDDLQLECKLCSKQLESDAQLKLHVVTCALDHEDRNRFCVTCNRKFFDRKNLKCHRMRFHGTDKEKLRLFKFKCHLCPKKYQKTANLKFHLKSHKETKQRGKTSNSKFPKCSHPNCGKEFRFNSDLRRHMESHSGDRPFSCEFPNCNKSFSQISSLNIHLGIHTGERPFKCAVESCNKAFTTSYRRSRHHRTVHSNL